MSRRMAAAEYLTLEVTFHMLHVDSASSTVNLTMYRLSFCGTREEVTFPPPRVARSRRRDHNV